MTIGDDIRTGIRCGIGHVDATIGTIDGEARVRDIPQVQRAIALLGRARAALIEAREEIGRPPR